MKNPRVGFVSLGCPKALVDSERILTRLRADGYEISRGYDDADLVVVNTCGFIDAAVEESLDSIGEALAENGRVIVTGCLGARKAEIQARHPGVLEITGPHAYDEVVSNVHKHLPPSPEPFTALIPPQGIKLTPRHYAYLKISEGCNHRCTFCIIPSMRGDLVSRPIGDVMREAETLTDAGVRELLIVSQDTSAYGVDLKYRPDRWQRRDRATNLAGLAEALGQLGIWIRLHYVYPYPHVDQLIPMMAEGKILPYLDIPLQHASSRILKFMKRPASAVDTLARIRSWREICPEITIRSTFIVGFPGETETEFQELLAFLEEARLDRVGGFKYSPVQGAAANQLPDPVPESLKEQRLEELMTLQAEISAERLKNRIGKTETVLVDEITDEAALARSRSDAPEIDGLVFIDGATHLEPGDFVRVVIEDSDDHDLGARLAGGH
ncbi:MAG: 30S ribosomal protein S12 methylthiotransferase RimO [Methylococcales bacterium]